METLGNENKPETSQKYYCSCCDYGTSKISNYTTHNSTAKHLKRAKNPVLETFGNQNKPKTSCSQHFCEKCNKEFKNRSGLWKHKQKCSETFDTDSEKEMSPTIDPSDKELIIMLIKKNDELQNMMMEVIKNGTIQNSHNTTNSHNKAFNLNFFLNETCKDAMNITEFVESIKLQLSDLERVGELGYVEGISNIIVKNLKNLDVTQRPVHCTDKKRETMYIKDEDKWEKDDEQKKMHKMVRKVADKNARMLPKFKEAHPDCLKSASRYSDQYNKIIMEAMGGRGDNDFEKEEKIIKRVSKEVIVSETYKKES
jgi:hypothetical protein